MNKQNFDINGLRVASPCSVGWETMTGNERVRHCHSCKLNIYNVSEMTSVEVENLIANHEGRLCIRLYKRSDGTVLTKDCPVGFRAYRKRAARFAGAAFAAILGLFSISYGQKEDKKIIDASTMKIVKTVTPDQESILSGIIYDANGAVVPGIEIKLYKKSDKKKIFKVSSDKNGFYSFNSLLDGTYILETKAEYGFDKSKIINIEIKKGKRSQLNIILKPKSGSTWVGIYSEEPVIDTTSSSVTYKITRDMTDKLPH